MEPLRSPLTRRRFTLLGLGGLSSIALSPTSSANEGSAGPRPRAVILLWLAGGPSQIETFDPKPGKGIGGPTKAIKTSAHGIEIAEGLPLVAEQMQHLALIRSVVGKEGDHERGTVLMKTGRRPEVALTHPSLGAVCAHELPEAGTEIPRYVSILDSDAASRGGFLGQAYDAFRVGDPKDPIQDVKSPVSDERHARRLEALSLLERRFAERHPSIEPHTLHQARTARALRTMSSAQLAAFHVDEEPTSVRDAYGTTPFGRGCLTARRLVEVGVRCVEVTLGGWDTHVDNFGSVARLNADLDPAFAALVRDLRDRDLWRSTLVACAGEFGRTPVINPAEGRDHWPTGFSVVLGGIGIQGGRLIGETSDGTEPPKDPLDVADVYATLLTAVGLDPATENVTDIGRPVKLSEGKAIAQLFSDGGRGR